MPFTQINTQDQDLNRVQANIASALNPTAGTGATLVKTASYSLQQSDQFLFISPSLIQYGSSGVYIQMLDATKYPGQSFSWKRRDSSTTPIYFQVAGFLSLSGQAQTIENVSPYIDTTASSFATFASDGSNWWLI
jgi:hypothetical protein